MTFYSQESIPTKLWEEMQNYKAQWGNYLQKYTDLDNNLDKLLKSVGELLSPDSPDSGQESHREVQQSVGEGTRKADALELAEDERVRESYHRMNDLMQWLHRVLSESNHCASRTSDMRQQVQDLENLVAEGQDYETNMPPHLQGLKIPLEQRVRWLQERITVRNELLGIVADLSGTGPFRSLNSPFTDQREDLGSLRDLTPAEEEVRSKIEGRIRKREWEQTRNTVFLSGFAILVGAILYYVMKPPPPVGPGAAPTPTNTPVVVTATSGPTNTPTLTPTPTITPTPTPTPEVIGRCISNGQRWVLSEPGHGQGKEDKAYHAGYVKRGEVVGVLRNVPRQEELRADWVKILIRRGDSEFRGWLQRDWMDCP